MPEFRSGVRNDTGSAVVGATVDLYDVDTTTPSRANTTTDASGDWGISHATRGRFDVKVANGSDVVWLRARDRVQFSVLDLNEVAANQVALVVTRSEDVASVEVATFEGDRATPADGDLAYIQLSMSDDAGNQDEQARIGWSATTVADGATQDGDLILSALTNNSLTEYLRLDGSAGLLVAGSSMQFDDSTGITLGTGSDATIQYDGTDVVISPAAVGAGDVYISGGSLEVDDSEAVRFGTGKDASISYDGTNLLIQPQDVGTGDVVINDAAVLFINDTTNADMTVGLTITSTADDEMIALKSDVGHALTSIAETDTFFSIRERTSAGGGVTIRSLSDTSGGSAQHLRLESYATGFSTTKTTAGHASIENYVTEHDDAGTLGNVTADSNIFNVSGVVSGVYRQVFMVDIEGDVYADVATAMNIFDEYDDAALVRALDLATAPDAVLNSEWDRYVEYNEQTLIDTGILGASVEEGGMINVTRLQKLHNGAIWQLSTMLKEVVNVLTPEQKKALPARLTQRIS